jgi:uridine kinase
MTAHPYVVAISGISGAGKTSVVNRTADLLGGAARLFFDDYDSVSAYPPDLKAWLEAGADVDEWKTPRFSGDLRTLRSGQAIWLPKDRRIVEPTPVIIIEEPFGKLRQEMEGLIDLAVHVDVPPDVLLARRLLRRMGEESGQYGDRLLGRLEQDLREHLTAGRDLDARGAAVIRDSADVILDGTKPVDQIAAELVAKIG